MAGRLLLGWHGGRMMVAAGGAVVRARPDYFHGHVSVAIARVLLM